MCTLTYLPLKDGFILTGNRDESIERKAAIPPKQYKVDDEDVVYPKDGEAGGSWMAASGKLTACLMNGGFERHVPQPPYRKSRGLVLLDLFKFESPKKFTKEYGFNGIEPFTIVAVTEETIDELRWDGQNIFSSVLQKDEPRIWSSTQLYTEDVRKQREEWFAEWLQAHEEFERDKILNFHRFKGEQETDEEKIVIDRGILKTVSISSVQLQNGSGSFLYNDLLKQETSEITF